jgi:hypothetical protein
MLARRRRHAVKATFAGVDLGRRKARKGKGKARRICVKVGKRVFCGRPVAAPKKAKRARRRK